MRKYISIPLLCSLLASCSCTHPVKKLDLQSAVTGNDLTVLTSGCGQQISVGYLVCRMPEGSKSTEEYFYIHAPPNIRCEDKEGCVYFKIFFPDGRPTYEGVVKQGESFARVSWADIINKPNFDISDRGFYGLSVVLNFKLKDQPVQKAYANGYLFMHVVKKEYTSLLENEEDENFIWVWKTPTNQTIKMTSGFRVYVSEPYSNPQSTLSTPRL